MSSTAGNVIEVRGLVKRYGAVTAVDGLDFSVPEGALFAFLGPNGAGKTTTINVLCTALSRDEGQVTVNGYEVGKQNDEVRRSIGVVFQHSVLDNLLTVRENLDVRAGFYGIRGAALRKRVEYLTEAVSLGEFIDRRYGKLSGGQKRRADVARALIHTPKVLFLDEPTTGLDPQTRLRVWSSISRTQQREKMTVFLTTHYMEEAATADDVAIIDHGRIAAQGTPASLKSRHSGDSLIIVPRHDGRLSAQLTEMGMAFTRSNDTVVVTVRDSMDALTVLKQIEPLVASFEVIKGSMDDVFMSVTGHAIRGEEET
ncbi:MAG TPA: ATP-binding cassette domain-containing protein [Spirochaetia bacterium]|nr:ATP-binding cassette domain-containing protein [Spirochaetia bacterium]